MGIKWRREGEGKGVDAKRVARILYVLPGESTLMSGLVAARRQNCKWQVRKSNQLLH